MRKNNTVTGSKLFCGLMVLTSMFLLRMLMPEDASAAVSPGEIRELQRRQEHIIQQQDERFRMQAREFLESEKKGTVLEQPELLPHVEGENNAPCLQVNTINVAGVTLLSKNTLSKILRGYEGRCLTLADINNLLRDISNAYIERGYITARAFVDPSSTQGDSARPNLLRVLVVEGFVEDIIVNDGEKNSYYRGKTAFPGLIGKPLNLRDIEQGLDQLNRLASAEASMELEPGRELGGTVVRVANRTGRSWRMGLGMDNLGQFSTGEGMYNLSLEKDNFMGIGDQWAIYWSEDIPFWDRSKGRERMGSNRALSAFFSIPYGYWTFSGNLSQSNYTTKIYGMETDYTASGETRLFGVKADRVLFRNQNSKTSASIGFTHRAVDSYFEGFFLDSSYKLAVLDVGLSHSRRILDGVASVSMGVARGMNRMGAPRYEINAHSTPKASFTKYTAMLSWYRPFRVADQAFYWSLSGYGQMTPHTLYGSERLQIGGRYSVRGLKNDSLSGDQGGYVTNELGWNLPWALPEKSPVYGVQAYVAYDWGMLHKDSRDPFERGRVQGAAIGIRTLGDLSLDASLSKVLERPSFLKARDTECYLSIKYTF